MIKSSMQVKALIRNKAAGNEKSGTRQYYGIVKYYRKSLFWNTNNTESPSES